jgi:hypothetical protein
MRTSSPQRDYGNRVADSHLLDEYLAVAGAAGGDGDMADARLLRGQFHDVVPLSSVADRFPRDEESRRLLR